LILMKASCDAAVCDDRRQMCVEPKAKSRNTAQFITPGITPKFRRPAGVPVADFGRRCPVWVKLRRTQLEQMSSELPLKADIARYSRQVSKVPKAEVAASFDHLVGQSKERRRYFDANCAGGLQIDRERQPRGS